MAITNIALNKAATASGYVKPFAPSMAVDGKYTPINRWLYNGVSANTPATLTVDLGKPCVITSWVVKHMGTIAGWATPDYNLSDFKLQGSLGNATWVNLDVVTANTSSVTNRPISTHAVYRYVRLYVSKGLNANHQSASVVELEIYGYITPYLSSLGLDVNSVALPINPAFDSIIFNYTTSNVPYSTSSINVVPIAQDPTASIKVNNTPVARGSSTPVALNVGSNNIGVVVTAVDGVTTQAYTVTVVREEGTI
ncbi:cadherin-like beta sandwich domain-containing protein [Clostridium aminobutyricum]|uniref:Cadherin-like beta sandwich domain-containing protein n=1 Tax=Clostridium aminobutyricum TaxID=33953 RepID=A0A939D8A8_CLOAM|nr:cadherin-like beta sandwich domain-containing protein [Clostridium aminobutyricum]MBN7773269.1 cadherin-like beta sandwich domain-containing protein [Clostridium aminobutyricum]